MNKFNARTEEMFANQFSQVLESVLVFAFAIVRLFCPERVERSGDMKRTIRFVPFLIPLLSEADVVRPLPVPEEFNRDGYPIDETTWEGSGQTYTVPVVSARKPGGRKVAAQAVKTERPVVKPARRGKGKAPAPAPALPPAPTGRKELQALAKAHGIKANLASVEIVRQLREKGIVS